VVIVSTLAGAILIGAAVYDVFHTLFHASGGGGGVSDWIARNVWSIFRRLSEYTRETLLNWAGAAAMAAVMLFWISGVVLGFALLYLPHMPEKFVAAPGLNISEYGSFIDALNLSIGSLITLTGDVMPRSQWIRLLMGLEAVLGFALLTASISWLLSVYPVLQSRKAIGHAVSLLLNAEKEIGSRVEELPGSDAQQVLQTLATNLTAVRSELMHFPITFYFREAEAESLTGVLEYLGTLAERGLSHREPSVRIAATMLGGALEDLLEYTATAFLYLPTHDKGRIIEAWAKHHMRPLANR
jgi:hypothetical protein